MRVSYHPMSNRFRIIGGDWRSRRFVFPDAPELRPSPDRVRETAFNWLMPVVEGARCLDLYAGSGALGLEALSRGAASCVFVDTDRKALTAIDGHLSTLDCARGRTEHADARAFLARDDGMYDIVFADPPFRKGMVGPLLAALVEHERVRAGGLVYVESEAKAGPPVPPDGWSLHRTGTAGQVGYHLLRGRG